MDDRVEFGREQDTDTIGNQRIAGRDSMFLQTIITYSDGTRAQGRVRNLSAGGMMVDVTRSSLPGQDVSAELRGLGVVQGQIAWCADGKAGIAFSSPIDPRMARKATPQSAGTGMLAVQVVSRSRRPPIRTT